MNIDTLLASVGLELVDGRMRAEAALGAGMPITVRDGAGKVYRLTSKNGKGHIEEIDPASPASGASMMQLLARRLI